MKANISKIKGNKNTDFYGNKLSHWKTDSGEKLEVH